MRQNELPPPPGSIHKKKRIGRGNASGHGTYAGRGLKGQKSRSGPDLRIGFEGGQLPLIRGLSRKRGFTNRFRTEYEPVNVGQLGRFGAGATVTTESLRTAGIVKSSRKPVKVLGDGEINVALTVEAERFSASARTKIETAGGKVVELNPAAAASEAKEPARRRPRAERAEPEEPAEPSPLPAAPATPEPTARRGRAQRAAPEAAAESNPVAGTDKAAETEEENA